MSIWDFLFSFQVKPLQKPPHQEGVCVYIYIKKYETIFLHSHKNEVHFQPFQPCPEKKKVGEFHLGSIRMKSFEPQDLSAHGSQPRAPLLPPASRGRGSLFLLKTNNPPFAHLSSQVRNSSGSIRSALPERIVQYFFASCGMSDVSEHIKQGYKFVMRALK